MGGPLAHLPSRGRACGWQIQPNMTRLWTAQGDWFLDVVQGGRLLWGLGAALWASISPLATPVVSATLSYQPLSYPATSEDQAPNSRVYFDKVIVADTLGNSWHFCGKNTLLDDGAETSFDRINITLTMNPCYVL